MLGIERQYMVKGFDALFKPVQAIVTLAEEVMGMDEIAVEKKYLVQVSDCLIITFKFVLI